MVSLVDSFDELIGCLTVDKNVERLGCIPLANSVVAQ